jgi:spore germination protein KA
MIINSKGWEKRSVTEPGSEAVVRGPRESFVENLRTNTSLIRRKIKNSALIVESMIIGRKTRTNISIAYINGVAKPELISEVKRRLKGIRTDSILESGYIEQFIEDAPGSVFATIGYTEKPDVAAAKILEGRVAILVDGTPFVLTAPFVLLESFQAAEDYYFRPYFATMTRIIRIIGFFITIMAPALYVAATTYHQELIPTSLLITFAQAREGVPFPAFVESLIMIITFEILREAGIRLPRPVGQALSIVGAFVIGESAVSAGIIGAPMVIVVAITAVSGFLVPAQNNSVVALRYIMLILGAALGGFGITLGLIGALVHMSSLESFGYPYLSPMSPFDVEDSKDSVIRAPLWLMISRPKGMAVDEQRREYEIPPPAEEAGRSQD